MITKETHRDLLVAVTRDFANAAANAGRIHKTLLAARLAKQAEGWRGARVAYIDAAKSCVARLKPL